MTNTVDDDQAPATPSAFKVAQLRYRRRLESCEENERRVIRSEWIDFSDPSQRRDEKYPAILLSSGGRPRGRRRRRRRKRRGDGSKTTTNGDGSNDDQENDDENEQHDDDDERDHDDYEGDVFALERFPGMLYAPRALSEKARLELAYLALTRYCESPHRTNIDSAPPRRDERDDGASMWRSWTNDQEARARTDDDGASRRSAPKRRASPKPYRSLEKLSWSTTGYHYDWTARAYREEARSAMPETLRALSRTFARLCWDLRGRDDDDDEPSFVFEPTASIVNFYRARRGVMGGHADDLEYTFSKPVVSISVGLPAVFLLGGRTKDEEPVVPILIRPGDVLVLGGESRLRYHGVAQVLPNEEKLPVLVDDDEHHGLELRRENVEHDWRRRPLVDQQGSPGDDDDVSQRRESSFELCFWSDADLVRSYLSGHRININVRQVLPDGVSEIPDDVNSLLAD